MTAILSQPKEQTFDCLSLTKEYTRILFKCEDGWKSTVAKIFCIFSLIIYPLVVLIDLFTAVCRKISVDDHNLKVKRAVDIVHAHVEPAIESVRAAAQGVGVVVSGDESDPLIRAQNHVDTALATLKAATKAAKRTETFGMYVQNGDARMIDDVYGMHASMVILSERTRAGSEYVKTLTRELDHAKRELKVEKKEKSLRHAKAEAILQSRVDAFMDPIKTAANDAMTASKGTVGLQAALAVVEKATNWNLRQLFFDAHYVKQSVFAVDENADLYEFYPEPKAEIYSRSKAALEAYQSELQRQLNESTGN